VGKGPVGKGPGHALRARPRPRRKGQENNSQAPSTKAVIINPIANTFRANHRVKNPNIAGTILPDGLTLPN